MIQQPTVQKSTIDLLSNFEGRRSKAYKDTAGKWTIGEGHLILPNEQHLITTTLSEDQIDQLLTHDLSPRVDSLNNLLKVKLPQTKWDALLSFEFNEGAGALSKSSLLAMVNTSQPVLEHHFTDWDKDMEGGKLVVNQGLLNRRLKEYQLFIS